MSWPFRHAIALVLVLAAAGGCQVKDDEAGPEGGPPTIPAPKDVAAPPADALKTPSGLASKVLIVGLGSIRPTPRSTVTVHYTGWTTDGKMFESSYLNGQPVSFPVGQVIAGWQEAVQLMVVGEKRRFWIPGDLAYDKLDMPGAPKGMLVFEIELMDIR